MGQPGKPGEQIQNVISVGMLSEGWDAKTVTHIMGLRAFTSQLLCEQVVGRGLRRTSYEINPETGLFEPEYVNIFGVPFTFLPHEGGEDGPPPPPTPKTAVEPDPEKARSRSRWPNIVRIDHVYRPRLTLDWEKVRPLELNASQTAQLAELAPMLEGKPDITKISRDRSGAARPRVPHAADHLRDGARCLRPDASRAGRGAESCCWRSSCGWSSSSSAPTGSRSRRPCSIRTRSRRRLIITLNMTQVVQHIWEAIRFENTERLEPVFDRDQPIRATGDMGTWYTGKPCEHTAAVPHQFLRLRQHLGGVRSLRAGRQRPGRGLGEERSSWLRDPLCLSRRRPEVPTGLPRPACERRHLVLETKGQDTEQDQTKRRFLDEWTQAVNEHGGFGRWRWAVSKNPGEIRDILLQGAEALATG